MKKLGFELIILGDPTAGKDTQASLLMKKYSLKPVESGKHWRAMLNKKNADGEWLKRTMGKGHPAPVALMKKFLIENIKNAPKNKNLVFIGNPRLKPEAQLLVKLLKSKNREFLVLYLKLSEKEIYARAEKRKVQDDRRSITKNRIDYHKNQVSKTVKYFQSLKKLKLINGNQPISKVTKDILKAIEDYKVHNK